MSAAFTIDLTEEAKATTRAVQTLPDNIMLGIARVMNDENKLTVSHIQQVYLSFPRQDPPVEIGCRAITGLLRTSIHPSDAVISGQVVSSAIGSNLSYAAPQEFGATIPAHTIKPKPGNKALRFRIGDRVIFAKSVNIPEVTLPGRGFVQSGIVDRLGNYAESTSREIQKVWNQ